MFVGATRAGALIARTLQIEGSIAIRAAGYPITPFRPRRALQPISATDRMGRQRRSTPSLVGDRSLAFCSQRKNRLGGAIRSSSSATCFAPRMLTTSLENKYGIMRFAKEADAPQA
jgi:hypothetical protein